MAQDPRDRMIAPIGDADTRRAPIAPSSLHLDEQLVRERIFRRLAGCLATTELEEALLEELTDRISDATALVALSTGAAEPARLHDVSGSRAWRSGDTVPPLLAAPIRHGDKSYGWIAYADNEVLARNRGDASQHLLEIASLAGIPAKNARRYEQAINLTLEDPLTGVYNRRAFEAFLAQESERSRRYYRPLSLLLLDLDRFKAINDTLGHPAGDTALRVTARLLGGTVRKSDIVSRIGGDEFAILLPNSDGHNARRLGRRILRSLRACDTLGSESSGEAPLSASIGASALVWAGGEAGKMFDAADRALLEAKKLGGNRVELATRTEDDAR